MSPYTSLDDELRYSLLMFYNIKLNSFIIG